MSISNKNNTHELEDLLKDVDVMQEQNNEILEKSKETQKKIKQEKKQQKDQQNKELRRARADISALKKERAKLNKAIREANMYKNRQQTSIESERKKKSIR